MQFIRIPICKIYFEQVYWELIPLVLKLFGESAVSPSSHNSIRGSISLPRVLPSASPAIRLTGSLNNMHAYQYVFDKIELALIILGPSLP